MILSLCSAATTAAQAEEAEKAAAKADVEFRYAYYPSAHTVRFLVLNAPDAGQWAIELRAAGKPAVLAKRTGAFPFNPAGETMTFDPLAEGDYELTLALRGPKGARKLKGSFTRQHFPWENNDLGKAAVVVPPFTPLVADPKRRTVDCILRTHEMSGAGLWAQVISQDRPLLTGPMRLEVVSDGKQHVAAGPQVVFEKRQPHEVTGHAQWSAGPMRGRTHFQFDYDGMMLVTLRLAPTEQVIDRMRLVIPMRTDETWLMHPVTDYLRDHYAGKIPTGQGEVWDSAGLIRHHLPGPFVPYIWIGGPQRGLCWFAENDRDWIVDPIVPAMEIRRKGKTVELAVNLIARPARIRRERVIVFGLQATPAKPMPTKPYSFRRWWPTGTKDEADVNFELMGATWYWGGLNAHTDFLPAGGDYRIFDEMAKARRTGKFDPKFVDEWMTRFTHLPQRRQKNMRRHVMSGLTTASRLPFNRAGARKLRYVLPYTSARSCDWSDKARTYTDEWSMYDITDPRWDRISALKRHVRFFRERMDGYTPLADIHYNMETVDSYVDMLLYHHKRMYETFADGIYWDNFFLRACYNPVSGPGYVADDGTLRPGVNLLGYRRLVKRNAVMMHQMGKTPMSYVHMTNVNIVPMLSFATLQLDWEWRDQNEYRPMDMQDRLEVDGDTSLILAMSTGLHTGNVSVAVDRLRPPTGSGVKREWLLRTGLAVCLTHEMRYGSWEVRWAIELLEQFGYGLDDCKVYRYWEPPHPVTARGAPVKTLILQRGKRAMIVVGSFGEGGDCTLMLDLAKLGLDAAAKAVNAETGKPLESPRPGSFVLPIKKHDVAFLRVE